VPDLRPAFSDGADGEFFMARRSKFSHNKHIERGVQRVCDWFGDRHTAARQGQNCDIRSAGKSPQ
jgi:hypothetical protein